MKIIGGKITTDGEGKVYNVPDYKDFVESGGYEIDVGKPTSQGAYKQYLENQGIETTMPSGNVIGTMLASDINQSGKLNAQPSSGGANLDVIVADLLKFTPLNLLTSAIDQIGSSLVGQSGGSEDTNTHGLNFDDELIADVYGIDPSYLGDLYSSDNYAPAQSVGGNDDSFIDQVNDVGLINAIINNMSAPQEEFIAGTRGEDRHGNSQAGSGKGGIGTGGIGTGMGGGMGGGQSSNSPYAPLGITTATASSPVAESQNVDGFFVRPSMLNTIPDYYDPRFADANNRFLQAQAINPSYLKNFVDMTSFVPIEEQLTSG